MAADSLPVHVVIPDTQCKPGVLTDHLEWIGRYIVDQFRDHPALTVVHLGDHWDMPSLSSYDKGKRAMEGRRVVADIEAGNEGFRLLNRAMKQERKRRQRNKERQWLPRRVLVLGNHENRIVRACEEDAQLDGLLGIDMLDTCGWEVHDFLVPVDIDGVTYAHYMANPMTGKPWGGAALTRLRTLGHSYSMGHQQTLDYAVRFVKGRSQHGLVCGAAYLHDEDFKTPQGNAHWRGIVVCHEVVDGSYDPMFVSLNYLSRKYAGVPLHEFMREAA